MDTLVQDLRYAVRSLLKSPGFALAVILTLALGIGANTTMFGVLDVLLLRPPARVARPDRLARVYFRRTAQPFGTFTNTGTSVPAYETLRDQAPSFASTAAFWPAQMSLGRGPEARAVAVTVVSHTFFPTLGVTPALGRFFGPDEDRAGGPGVAVLSWGFWHRRFQGDSAVLGRALPLGRGSYTVIGVAPEGFAGVDLNAPEMWLPLGSAGVELTAPEALTSRGWHWIQVIARLKDGVEREAAASLATMPYRRAARAATANQYDTATTVLLGPIQKAGGPTMSSDAKVSLWIGVVTWVVLLVACANVANLLLARGVGRRREIAVRIGLGASRGRLVRLLLVESLVLSLVGGAAAILIAAWGGSLVRAFLLPGLPDSVAILDWRVLGFTAGVALFAGVVAGLAPALQSVRTDVSAALKSGGGVVGGKGRLRTTLLAAQVAFTAVLLVGAGLFVRSVRNVERLDLGVDLAPVLTVSVDLHAAGIVRDQANATYLRLLERVQGHPLVERAAASVGTPFGWSHSTGVRVSGRDSLPQVRSGGPYFNAVTPDYFATLGLRIVRGRGFTAADGDGAAPVAVVGHTFARLVWPTADPIGQCLYVSGPHASACAQVVGVVEDARRNDIIEDPSLQYYLPLAQGIVASRIDGLLIRTRGRAKDAAAAIRHALQGAEPDLPYVSVESLEDVVALQLRSWRLGATMFGAFGLLALAVAAMGLYGVTSYVVGQRTQEIGLRIALGAQAGDVLRLVVGHGMRAAAIGAAVGVLGALALGRAVASLLYGVRPTDAVVFGAVVITLLAVAGMAALVPARRATKVDPMVALRSE